MNTRPGTGARSLVLLRGCASTVCDAGFACGVEPVAAGLADRVAPALVLVVGGDVADRGVQSDGVVLDLHAVELGVELAGVADLPQVRPTALGVPEQRLNPGFILRRVRAAQGEPCSSRTRPTRPVTATLTVLDPEPLRLGDHHRVPDNIRPCDGPTTSVSIHYTHGAR